MLRAMVEAASGRPKTDTGTPEKEEIKVKVKEDTSTVPGLRIGWYLRCTLLLILFDVLFYKHLTFDV